MTKRLTNRFPSADAKLQWAKRLIDQLDSQSDAYLRERLKFTVHEDFLRQPVMTMTYQGELPANFGLMIGDVVTNLRATLDHIIWYLVSPHLTANDREMNVRFPFPRLKSGLNRAIKDALIDRGGSDAARLIREIEPYPGGDDELCTLNDLANMDKHRIIAIVSDYAHLHGLKGAAGDSGNPVVFNNLRMGHAPGLARHIHISGIGVRVGQHGSVDHNQFDMSFHLAKFDEAYPSQFAPGYFAKDAWSAR
jgi:hypothetical protein